MSEPVHRVTGLTRTIASLDRLHPAAVSDPAEVRRVLERARGEHAPLWRGMNRRIDRETAAIESIGDGFLILSTRDFEPGEREAIFLNFELSEQPYFFSAPFESDLGGGRIRVAQPRSIYRAERRSRTRRPPAVDDAHQVALRWPSAPVIQAEIEDASPEGMGLRIPGARIPGLGDRLRVRLLDGKSPGLEFHGEVRSREPSIKRTGWTRIGLDLSAEPRSDALTVERRDHVVPTTSLQRGQRRWKLASAGVRTATGRALSVFGRRTKEPRIRIVDYENDSGERICGIVDSWGDTRGATAIVIPPAWGRTKETLMPLAATLVAGFRAARQPVVVLRYDGIRKRGESHNNPECLEPGTEHHRFTFSQGVRDIVTTLDFLSRSDEFRPSKILLVSFSAASIESRRAVATDDRIDGWVCVVGAADTQSMMRVVSGGVDYVAGIEAGVSFGRQQVLGVEVDIDHAGEDLLASSLGYLSDSRRDFAEIQVPVTWIHGKHDAWMDPDRARDVLARGSTANRRFLEVPTGHMLKSSAEALETFQLIAGEASRMVLGFECPPALPDLGTLDLRQRAERRRRRSDRQHDADLRGFWRGYLVGEDGNLGIELMTHTSPYEDLMAAQVSALNLRPGHLVADLGSGTGAFPVFLAKHSPCVSVRVLEIDYVRAGFRRAIERLAGCEEPRIDFVEANLDFGQRGGIPIRSEQIDSVLAGFFLSYVRDPVGMLREIRRVLKPGGRLVVSSLRRDADVSKLYMEGVEEIREKVGLLSLDGRVDRAHVESAARAYLNQASRLLDLEEAGRFRFWALDELRDLIEDAGFVIDGCRTAFGDPPQAVLVSANRA